MEAISIPQGDINYPFKRQRILQNFQVLWLTRGFHQSHTEHSNILALLKDVVHHVYIFEETDELIDYMTDTDEIRTSLIISPRLAKQLTPLIHCFPQLQSIYLLPRFKIGEEQQFSKWKKIKFRETDTSSISKALRKELIQTNQDSVPITIFNMEKSLEQHNLNELDPLFMYSQLMKGFLLDIQYDETSINDFLDYCQEKTITSAEILQCFRKGYTPERAIYSYTSPTFLYELVNKSLREMDTTTMIKAGFFIRDLHNQIQALHKQQNAIRGQSSLTVYRGQALSIKHFNALEEAIGGLISFNSFLSVSIEEDTALEFAMASSGTVNTQIVIFQIELDANIEAATYANISGLSYYPGEQEILFSMHSVFRICAIENATDSQKIPKFRLCSTTAKDDDLMKLSQYLQNTIAGVTTVQKIISLLIRIGKPKEAIQLSNQSVEKPTEANYKHFHENNKALAHFARGELQNALTILESQNTELKRTLPANHPNVATSYNNIASLYDSMGEYPKALSFYEKALEVRQKSLPADHPDVATSYNNIGMVYKSIGDYRKALSFYEKALAMLQKNLPANHPDLATSYHNVGMAYESMGEYSKALSFYEKALKVRQKSLPANHPDMATSYNNIGMAYKSMGDYRKALSFQEKALEIIQKTLPANHPFLAATYNNIGMVYDIMGEYSKTLFFYEKALEIRQKTLPANHPDVAISYNNIGMVHKSMGEYPKALFFYEKALAMLQKNLPANHPDLATSYHNVGLAYESMGEYAKALSFYEKALEIRQKVLPANHPDVATSYNNIAGLYDSAGEYPKALSYYEKALEIRQKSLPANHPDVATSYNNIGMAYKSMGEYGKAFSFYEKGLQMLQKSLPVNHPDVATLYNNIADLYDSMGEYAKAFFFYKNALEMLQKTLPANHPSLAAPYNNIGMVLFHQGNFATAFRYVENAICILSAVPCHNKDILEGFKKNLEYIRLMCNT